MNINLKKTCYILVLTIWICISLSSLYAVNKEDNDLVVIIGLYDDKLYDLAKKQINLFEREHKTSQYANTVTLIKANIGFSEKKYSFADSLYTNLINNSINQSMLAEILINKAFIKYSWLDNLEALRLLQDAEKLSSEAEHLYQIELLKGRINVRLYRSSIAQGNYEKALNQKNGDPVATYELLSLYLSADETLKTPALIESIITNPKVFAENTSSINIWLDYVLAKEDYPAMTAFEQELATKQSKIPDSILLRFAKLHFLTGNYERALQLISQGRTYISYRKYLKGLILVEQGNDIQADSIFAELCTNPDTYDNQLADSDEDLVIGSWLERIKILYKTSPDAALLDIKNYLTASTEEQFNPSVLYVYGSLLFRNKSYQEAAEALLNIRQADIKTDMKQNIQIMLGDIWFAAKIADKAKLAYLKYINMFPNGKFATHAIYNVALIDFESKDYKASAAGLNMIITESKSAEIVEKSQYLLAEIDFVQANYTLALEKYRQINAKFLKPNDVNFRIAQTLYYLEDYQAAIDYITSLEKDSTNVFQILMFSGNIYFNLKQYTTALTTYNQALTHTSREIEIQEVKSYIALTLYRLGRFKEASGMYFELSKEKESPEAYLIMAAKASYHAREFQQSLMLFDQFVTEHPGSEYYEYALANIGSIHYNQSDFNQAINSWVSLLKRYQAHKSFSDDEQSILAGVFSGLQWCFKQNPDQRILDELNDLIDTYQSEYIKFELQYLLLKVYYGDEQWSDLLQMADDLRKEFPQKENNEIRRYVAGSLSKLSRFAEADSVYHEIYKIEPTANILSEWAELELISGKSDTAIAKLNQALTLDTSSQRLNKLIKTVYEFSPDSLQVYWDRWGSTFDPPPSQSKSIMMQWNFDIGNWLICDSLANELLLNEELPIRSKAQLNKGISQYMLKNYDTAIIELYKAVYLYNDLTDIILEAKKFIVKTYVALGQNIEARATYNEIAEQLNPEEIAEFDKLFSGIQN